MHEIIDSHAILWNLDFMELLVPTLPETTQSNDTAASRFVDDYLLYQLASASHRLSSEFHAYVKSRGVKIYVWRVLACLVDQPGLMLTRLSALVLIEQSRLTKITDQMVGEGLVSKRADPTDRRKTMLYVTEKGAQTARPLIAQAKEHEEKSLRVLTAQERKSLKRVLKKLG